MTPDYHNHGDQSKNYASLTTIQETYHGKYEKSDCNLALVTERRKIKVAKGSPEEKTIAQSRQTELERLLEDGTFISIPESYLPQSTRIFCFQFIDELKQEGEQDQDLRKKSRLFSPTYSDTCTTTLPKKLIKEEFSYGILVLYGLLCKISEYLFQRHRGPFSFFSWFAPRQRTN